MMLTTRARAIALGLCCWLIVGAAEIARAQPAPAAGPEANPVPATPVPNPDTAAQPAPSTAPQALPGTVTESAPPAYAPPPPPPPPVIVEPAPAPMAPAPIETKPADDKDKWRPTLYGFVELDMIGDSTQSFNDLAGNANMARPGSYAYDHGRGTIGARNSRLGFKLLAPDYGDIKVSALAEMDFFGNQPAGTSESAVFASPLFRMRHMWLKMEDPYVDILAGQSWQLFGWQSYFHPNTVEIQGVPGQVYSRAPQLRLSHRFKSEDVDFEMAAAAARPPQRNSFSPDGQAGLRLFVNGLKGARTAGSTGSSVDAAAIGVSGVLRRFAPPEFAASPKASVSKMGWGVSADMLLPIIPATAEDKGGALTLTASYARGEGIADLFTGLNGGVTAYPALPNPKMATPAPTYTSDVDAGLVMYDANGNLHTIGWQAVIAGLQFYLPPSGKVWLSANYSHMDSHNAKDLGDKTKIFDKSQWADLNLFWDAVPRVRFGLEGAWFEQTWVDEKKSHNVRVQLSSFYIF